MAGVLSFKSISYSQNLILAKIFRTYFPFYYTVLTFVSRVSMAFQRLLLLEYGGGPEKDRDVCLLWWDSTRALPGFALPAGCLLA